MAEHIDPVCGMSVEEKDAAGLAEYKGTTYYFESEDCITKFNEHRNSMQTNPKEELSRCQADSYFARRSRNRADHQPVVPWRRDDLELVVALWLRKRSRTLATIW